MGVALEVLAGDETLGGLLEVGFESSQHAAVSR
jgi:hypothetical protein